MSRYAPWRRRLDDIRDAGRWRVLRTLEPTGPVTALADGRSVTVACSNDYLGLSWHPEVRAAARGGGAGGSRLISGDRPAHRALEDAVERWLGRRALVFTSGWLANLAVLSTACEEGELVASDALNHASIIDGLRLSRARRQVVPHGDGGAVPHSARLVVVEGLYSMDGDAPDLTGYPREPWLMVDEAHAVGCLGPAGRGAAAAQGVEPDIVVGTFGKAFGAGGAFASGPAELIELLVNAGRSFIFTTGLPEPVAWMALAGLEHATDERRERLAANAAQLRRGLADLGWDPLGQAHIVPIVVGDGAMDLSARLLDAGVLAPGIRWPTVPRGAERLRFTVSSEHTPEQLDRVCDALGPKG